MPREEIFIHTDRSEYISGEVLWFNIYLIDRQMNEPSSNSKIAYFELLNTENKPVLQKRIRLEKGFGPGDVILPDTLSSGKYILRAYTNWMKNFLPVNCFMKELNIYNPLSNKDIKGRPDQGNKISRSPAINTALTSRPGFSFRVNNMVPDTLKILIDTDNSFRLAASSFCHLIIETHGIINLITTVKLNSEESGIDLPKGVLTPGINHITFFDSGGKLLGERFIYTPPKQAEILTLDAQLNAKVRTRIPLEIEIGKGLVSTLEGTNLSISVSPLTDSIIVSELDEYMVFGTEFGTLPDNIRNSRLSDLAPEILDNFLLSVRSNWIDWEIILSGNYPSLKYEREEEDHFLYGTLINKNSEKNDSGKCVFLSVPGKKAIFQYARTDKKGSFNFRIPINEGSGKIIIQPEDVNNNNTVRIESAFSEVYMSAEKQSDTISCSNPDYISEWGVNYQVSKIYELPTAGDLISPIVAPRETKRFYGKPDVELVLADYIKLPVMEEVFFELTTGILLKSKKSVYTMSISDPADNSVFKKPPVLFIDGVVINDPATIAEFDPELVEKIEAVKELYVIGDFYFFGLVNVITRAGDYSGVTLPDYAIRLNYRVIDPPKSFISPDYSTDEMKQSRIPDLRNTLYWNPAVKPDNDGKVRIDFWASDYRGMYEINVQGVTADGKLVSFSKKIKVE
jgi:hypothetical protein